MTKPMLMALLLSAALAQTPAAAQPTPVHPGAPIRMHICPKGETWQKGCLKWGPTPPGKLFGQCLKQGYGCFRAPEQIQ